MVRIAVTGATGFLGKSLVLELKKEQGIDLKLFDRNKYSLFSLPSLDSFVEGSDIVYHLAGINDPSNTEIYKVNVIGTINLLESIRKSCPNSRLIFASSFAVYKTPSKRECIDEKYPTIPRNYYGFTKLLAEEVINFYYRTYKIKSTILRFSNIYGKGMPSNKHSVISNLNFALNNKSIFKVANKGVQTRDFLYIDDAISALIKAKELDLDYGIYNVCSGREVSINKLISLFEKSSNKRVKVKYNYSNFNQGFWKGNNKQFTKACHWGPETVIEKGIKNL